MSFLHYFGFRDYPFQLTPNTEYFFHSGCYEENLGALLYAITRGEGICKVVGQIGTGKTLLSRMLIKQLNNNYAIAILNNPQNDSKWIIYSVLREFGLIVKKGEDPFHVLNNFLIAQRTLGKGALIIIDEAQALGAEGLEAIRLLSNLETDKRKLLQIVLFGQSELDELLSRHDLRQVSQRILFNFTTEPLKQEEVGTYIIHRLQRALVRPDMADDLFSYRALKLIAKKSYGIPRLVNILADKSLLAAHADGTGHVIPHHVRHAIADSKNVLETAYSRKPIDFTTPSSVLIIAATLMFLTSLIILGFLLF